MSGQSRGQEGGEAHSICSDRTVHDCRVPAVNVQGTQRRTALSNFARPDFALAWSHMRHQEVDASALRGLGTLAEVPQQPMVHQGSRLFLSHAPCNAIPSEKHLVHFALGHHCGRGHLEVAWVTPVHEVCGLHVEDPQRFLPVALLPSIVETDNAVLPDHAEHTLLDEANELFTPRLSEETLEVGTERFQPHERQYVTATPTETELHHTLELVQWHWRLAPQAAAQHHEVVQCPACHALSASLKLSEVNSRGGRHAVLSGEAHLRDPHLSTEHSVEVRGMRPRTSKPAPFHVRATAEELTLSDATIIASRGCSHHGPQKVPRHHPLAAKPPAQPVRVESQEVVAGLHEHGTDFVLTCQLLSDREGSEEEVGEHGVAGHRVVRPLAIRPVVEPPQAKN